MEAASVPAEPPRELRFRRKVSLRAVGLLLWTFFSSVTSRFEAAVAELVSPGAFAAAVADR